MMRPKFLYFLTIIYSMLIIIAVNCSVENVNGTDRTTESSTNGTASSDTVDEEETTDVSEIITSNTLALSYPDSLSLSILPESSTSSSSLRLTQGETRTLKEKKIETDKMLKGDVDSCLPPVFNRKVDSTRVTCYEFDQEMIYGTSPGGRTFGTRDGTAANGEACLVAFARSRAKRVENLIDKSLGLIQGMLCQAKKEGKASDMPEVGNELDLSSVLSTAMGNKISKVSNAKISRLADQNERPVYRIDITVTKDTEVREIHLVHSPQSSTDNSTYDGVLWSKVTGFEDPFGGDGESLSQPKDPHLSVQYSKIKNTDDSYSVQAEFLRGNVHSDLSEKAFVNGILDLNVGADFEVNESDNNYGSYKKNDSSYYQHNQAVTGMVYIAFNLNPDDSTGTISFWRNPGSNYSENARGMMFNLKKDEDTGLIHGCGVSGATTGNGMTNALSIRKAKKEKTSISANGFLHPFANTERKDCTAIEGTDDVGEFYSLENCQLNLSQVKWYKPTMTGLDENLVSEWITKQSGSIISRQCVKQNVETGLYEIDSSLISANAGFELLDTTDSAVVSDKKILPPILTGIKSLEIE